MNTKKLLISLGALLVVVAIVLSVILLPASFWKWGRADSKLHSDSLPILSYAEEQLDVDIKSPQAFVYSVSDDTIVCSKGEDKVIYPGSITKLLTVLCALTVLDPDEVITPSDELDLVKPGSSIAYIKKHHRLTVEMLIEGILLPSGNDAAYVLAAAAGRKMSNNFKLNGGEAIDAFMEHLRDYAEHIGLCGTNFTVPDGFADDDHYTTTEDLIIVSRLALECDIIKKYARLAKDDVVYDSGHTNTWHNTNLLLDKDSEYYSPFAIGLKTGSLDGEYSLVFAFKFDDGREYIAGVFGHGNKNMRFNDAIEIINELK